MCRVINVAAVARPQGVNVLANVATTVISRTMLRLFAGVASSYDYIRRMLGGIAVVFHVQSQESSSGNNVSGNN